MNRRRGSVYRRCRRCGRKAQDDRARRCQQTRHEGGPCGGEIAWAFVVDVGDDRRQRRTGSGFGTKAEAMRAMTEAVEDNGAGDSAVRPETVRQYLSSWIEDERSQIDITLKPSSWRTEELHVRRYISPFLGDRQLKDLTTTTITEFYRRLEGEGSVRSGGPLSKKTVANIHLTLHKVLEAAREHGYMRTNPADGAYSTPKYRKTPSSWTAEELRRFLDSCRDDRLHPLWRLAAMSGMRRGELLGLRWMDVDFQAGTVSVCVALVRGQRGIEWTTPKSEAGVRSIDIDPETLDTLRAWKRTQAEERLRLGAGMPIVDLVFTRPDSEPLDPDVVSQRFREAVRSSGVRAIRLHDVRHTSATLLLKAGTPAHLVSRRLGHSSEAFTLRQYAHVLPDQQAEAARMLAQLVDGADSSSDGHQRNAS